MFLSPYETTVCRNHRMDDIRLELVHMFLEGELRPDQDVSGWSGMKPHN